MTKRQRFVTTSLLLSIGFVAIQIYGQDRLFAIAGLGILTLLLFVWSLKEGLGINFTLLTIVLPIYFTLGVGLFWFLLPANIYAQIPIVAIYGLGIYALCLTANIYTVSAIRTIALLRAAHGVGFVISLFTLFLVYDAILSLRANILFNGGMVIILSFPLFYQSYWSVSLKKIFDREILLTSLVSSLVIGEVSLSLYFWPVTVVVGSLFLTVAGYVLLGLGQAKLEGRLFSQTVREYLILATLVFIGMFFATRWGT
jgi:hypothetical protein